MASAWTAHEYEAAAKRAKILDLGVLADPEALADHATSELHLDSPEWDDDGPTVEESGNIIGRIGRTLKATYKADPRFRSSKYGSLDIVIAAPQVEIDASVLRTEQNDHTVDWVTLPATTLAVEVVSALLTNPDPEQATAQARGITAGAADALRSLSATLQNYEVDEFELRGRPWSRSADGEHFDQLIAALDRASPTPPEQVELTGVLEGANSRGEGLFDLVTSEAIPLPRILQKNRKPGVAFRGSLTPKARKKIREDGLWDHNVVAFVEVSRTIKGSSERVDGLRLLDVRRL